MVGSGVGWTDNRFGRYPYQTCRWRQIETMYMVDRIVPSADFGGVKYPAR
jgi:hypothetical protein